MKKTHILLLILSIASKLYSIDIYSSINNIWSEKDGNAYCVTSSFNINDIVKNNSYYLNSTVPLLSGSIFGDECTVKTTFPHFTLNSKIGFLSLSDFSLNVMDDIYGVKSFTDVYGGFSSSFYIKNILFEPFIYFTTASSSGGDFYYFYGNPNIDYAYVAGISSEFLFNKLSLFYVNTNLVIGNEIDSKMIDFSPYVLSISYLHNFEKDALKITPSFSYIHSSGNLKASLTNKNQTYFLFPYKYYDVRADVDIDLISTGCEIAYNSREIKFSLDSKIFYFANQRANIEATWLHKKNFMFDGSIGRESYEYNDLTKAGLITLIPQITCFAGQDNMMEIVLMKQFLIPFTLNKTKVDEDEDSEILFDSDFVINYLLSCLSFNITIHF